MLEQLEICIILSLVCVHLLRCIIILKAGTVNFPIRPDAKKIPDAVYGSIRIRCRAWFSSDTEAGLKRKATGIIVLIKQMMKILYCKNKSKSTKITIDMNCLVCL